MWIRDYAKDRCERCTALLSTVQGPITLKRFHQCNPNGATHGRCDILLFHVRNVCRPRHRIGHRTLTRLFLADALEYELAEVDRLPVEASERCGNTFKGAVVRARCSIGSRRLRKGRTCSSLITCFWPSVMHSLRKPQIPNFMTTQPRG